MPLPVLIDAHIGFPVGPFASRKKAAEFSEHVRWNGAAAWVTEGRLNDPIEWSAPLSLQPPRISICSSRVNLTIAAKPVYLKNDRTSPMTPALRPMIADGDIAQRSIGIGQIISRHRTDKRGPLLASSNRIVCDIFQYELRRGYTRKTYISEIYMRIFVFTHIIKSILWL
jgi:hypothetical protein